MSISDLIKNKFVEEFTAISVGTLLTTLLLSFALGLFVLVIYRVTYGGVSFSKSFALSLVMLSMVTALAILTVRSNVVLSLGKPVAARAVSQILGRDLTVTFWNDRVYIDYGWHHVTASMDSLERALYAVLTVTPGVDRQTVQNAIEAYTYFFEHLSFASVVGAISDFGYADGALNITANIAASPLYISLTPSRITLRTQVDAANLTVTATPGSAYAAAPDLSPQGGSYRNLDDFLALFPSW